MGNARRLREGKAPDPLASTAVRAGTSDSLPKAAYGGRALTTFAVTSAGNSISLDSYHSDVYV